MSEFVDPPTRSGQRGSGDEQTLRIEEAAAELGVEAHVLTFWEGLFPRLTPKTESGRRYYNAQDMAMLRYIRNSLIDRKLSVTVVRRRLKRWQNTGESVRSILQARVSETSDESAESGQMTKATVRDLHSAVSRAAESGVFASTESETTETSAALVERALERLEAFGIRLDQFRSRLS